MIVPATSEIVHAFYGRAPQRSLRALAFVVDGEVLAVSGFYKDGDVAVAFADVRPKMRERHVLSGMKFAKRVMAMIAESGVSVIAVADAKINCSARFLEHMGFAPLDDKGAYLWRA